MFPREEVEAAFAEYLRLGIGSYDWEAWTQLFTADARYVEHNLGVYEGRDAIAEWMLGTLAGFPTMTFSIDWSIIDGNRVTFYIWNNLPDPTGSGRLFAFPNATVIEYAGGGKWGFEEDYYNPADGNRVVKAWLDAGGRRDTPPDRALAGIPDVYPSPGAAVHPVEEVEQAVVAYAASAARFTADAVRHDHGEGRLNDPSIERSVEWHMIAGNRVVMRRLNRLRNGVTVPAFVVLHYAGQGQWSYEEDIYNPDEAQGS